MGKVTNVVYLFAALQNLLAKILLLLWAFGTLNFCIASIRDRFGYGHLVVLANVTDEILVAMARTVRTFFALIFRWRQWLAILDVL